MPRITPPGSGPLTYRGAGVDIDAGDELGVHDTIGFDLVGMCVNDIITSGARPQERVEWPA